MIADYFPPERRATAFGIYSLGIPIGGAFGVFAGGWINEWFDRRTAFLVVGLPGGLLAIVSQLTLREPPRVAHASGGPASAASVARHLGSLASFRHLSIAGSLHALVAYGVGTWNAAFLMRTHGMGTGEAGTWLALLALVAGGLGTYLGGVLVDRLGRRDARWSLWLPGLSMLVAAPFSVGFYLLPSAGAALACAAEPDRHGPRPARGRRRERRAGARRTGRRVAALGPPPRHAREPLVGRALRARRAHAARGPGARRVKRTWLTRRPGGGSRLALDSRATLPHMKRVGIRELQQHASGVLRRVRAGEGIEVTERGHPVAVLIPRRGGSALEALRAEGRVTPSEGDLLDLGPPLPSRSAPSSASARLRRLRATER
jgi:prevent-host-death family protein